MCGGGGQCVGEEVSVCVVVGGGQCVGEEVSVCVWGGGRHT